MAKRLNSDAESSAGKIYFQMISLIFLCFLLWIKNRWMIFNMMNSSCHTNYCSGIYVRIKFVSNKAILFSVLHSISFVNFLQIPDRNSNVESAGKIFFQMISLIFLCFLLWIKNRWMIFNMMNSSCHTNYCSGIYVRIKFVSNKAILFSIPHSISLVNFLKILCKGQ